MSFPILWFPIRPSFGETLSLVDGKTMGALTGLILLSRGLEASGALARVASVVVSRVRSEREIAFALMVLSVLLAATVTNDVALFIVVPLTVSMARWRALPLGRLIILEALAVNAGSALSPIGNPQNLFLWQHSGVGFIEFVVAMAPLAGPMLLPLLGAVWIGFRGTAMSRELPMDKPAISDFPLLKVTLFAYPVYLLAIDFGGALWGAGVLLLGCAFWRPSLLHQMDWGLLAIFLFMFLNLGLLASFPGVRGLVETLFTMPGGVFSASVVVSQCLSNVPAAILLVDFSDDWVALAWGVNVGGFGLAIGSMANLIALRLAPGQGLWIRFHYWSIPWLIVTWSVVWIMLR